MGVNEDEDNVEGLGKRVRKSGEDILYMGEMRLKAHGKDEGIGQEEGQSECKDQRVRHCLE